MKDAAQAKAALQGMSDAVKAETAAEVAGSTAAATARGKDIVAIQQETQAMSQLANAAKQTNVQLLYGGRNDMTQHLSDMAQELNYTTLLNRQKWLGFSSVQQAMSYRQQMYNLSLLENKAHFAGYLTADQYLGFLQREIAETAALSAAIRDRSAAIATETGLLLAHANALQGTHQTAGSLGGQLAGATALSAAIAGLPTLVTTRAELNTSPAMAELAAYRAALLSLPHTETTDIISAATRLGGVPLTPPSEAVPVSVTPEIDYAAINQMLARAVSRATPEPLRAPLAITASGEAPAAAEALSAASDETDALSEAMDALSDKAAVSAEAIGRFQDSLALAAVDARALEQGVSRLTAAEQLLGEVNTAFVPQKGRKAATATPQQGYQNLADYYGLTEVAGAARSGEISNVPGGYPVRAPMQLVAPPEGEEEDFWSGLSKYMTGGKATEQVAVEGGQEAEATLDKIAVQMEWLDKEDARPHLELEGGEEALEDAYHLDGVLVGLTYERAEPEVELQGGAEAVTEADLLANEMAFLNERAARLGVDFSEVEEARMAAEELDGELHELPPEVDTILVVDATGAGEEVRDYSADIAAIEREVGTRADFEDTEAESGLSAYLAALLEAVQRRYDFYAGFNDEEAKTELAGWISELEAARAEEDRLFAGMGGAAGGGGGGGSPPIPPVGGADDEFGPEEEAALELIAKAMNDVDEASVQANQAVYDVKAGIGGLADPAAKAAAALTNESNSATNLGWRLSLLRTQITLWSGVFGNTPLLGEVALWHIALDGIIEILALWVPALATAAAGLVAFGLAGYSTFKSIYQQWQSLTTVSNALGTTIKPLTDNFQNLQNAVRPQIYELLGDYLTAAGDKTGVFSNLIQETGDYLDKFAAKIVVDMQSGGKGLSDFFASGIKDLQLIGQGFDSLGTILVKFLQATAISHIAEDLATIGDFILKIAADIVSIVPAPVLAVVLGLHALVLWGGLAADAVGKVVIGIAGLLGKFPALNSAAMTVAQALNATNDQLVNIAKSSAEVGAVSDVMGAKTTEEELAQLSVSIQATGQSIEEFVTAAGTTSAARLERFSEGLDDSGRSAVALGIAAGASDTQLAGLAEKLGGAATGAEDLAEGGSEAAEAVGGGGGLLASLGSLLPMLSNVYVDLGLLAAALIAVGVYLGTRADQTKQFTDAMGQAVQKASLLTVVGTTVSNLAEVTETLNKTQQTGVGNASELAASQADLSGKLQEELTHVGAVSQAYGVSFVGALSLLNAAGVTTTQLFTNQSNVWAVAMQQVKGLIAGYQAMGQQLGAVGSDLNVLNLQNSQQVTSMGQLNSAYDTWTKTVGAAPTAFITLAQGFAQFATDAKAAGASMTGLSAPSLTLQNDFQSNYNNVEAFFDAFRNDQALTGQGNFTQFVKDAVASLIPMAGGSKEAAAQISALAQEAGGPATDNIKTLEQWVGNIKDPLQAMYTASNNAAIGASNLSQDAARLTNTLQNLLDPAMANAIFNAHGGQQVFADFADSLAKSGPSSGATIAAAKNVATELLAVSGSSASAKANFVGFAEASGLSAKQADQLWAQATQHITANLNEVRTQLASSATEQSNLVKPGETAQMVQSFKDGTFYEVTFLAWIPQVQRGLEIMNHDIGQFFVHDVPAAAEVTGHAFEAAWDGMVNWFSNSVPHGLEMAWDTVSSFFDKAFTHDIPEGWNTAWANTVSPVAHAFDTVKTWIAANFDKWWTTHGSAVEEVWNVLWTEVSGAAIKAFNGIKDGATGLWHVLVSVFTSGPAKQLWAAIESAGIAVWQSVWQMASSGAKATWIEIEGITKAAWDIVAALAKAAWDIIVDLGEAGAKAIWAVVEATGKIAWDVVVALAKVAWDTIVVVVDEFLDLITGHWSTAWKDLESYGIQVWNALKTAGIQTWNALSTAGVQVWNALWDGIKTAAVQVWDALKTGAVQAWNAIWSSLETTFVNPMTNFFTSTVPKWWDDFANSAASTWDKVWGGFEKSVLTPVENWFTSTLPNAMWNSLKGGIDRVISGLNTVIGWINDVTSIVGVHIGSIPMLASGGVTPARMASGSVPGTGDEDGTHIIAMGGEYMLRKPARMALQAAFGPDFLDYLNHADTWLGSGSRGSAATQRQKNAGRYAGGGILGDIGSWLGDAGSAIASAATSVWDGVGSIAADIAKDGERAVFNGMWTALGVPMEDTLKALGVPGDIGASWLQNAHDAILNWMNGQTSAAQAQAATTATTGGSTGGQRAVATASGGPVASAIEGATPSLSQREAMGLGSWLLTRMNPAATDTAYGEYGAWLLSLARHRGVTQAQAQNPVQAAHLVAPAYARGVLASTPAAWKSNPGKAALTAFTSASGALGTHWVTPSAQELGVGLTAVREALDLPVARHAAGGGLGSVAGMFTMAAGGVVPGSLVVPGLSANMTRQLAAATAGQLPRTLGEAAGSKVGLQVDQLTINNPVAEKPSESITRASNRLAFLGGRGVI
jgi:hypothetical protein